MKYTHFEEATFRRSVDKALDKVRSILGTAKNPRLAEQEVDHTYDDKYALAEFLTNTGTAAQLTILERLGLTPEQVKTVTHWVHKEQETVTLQFEAQDGCTYLKEREVEVVSSELQTESTTQSQSQSSFFGAGAGTRTEKTKHRVIQKVKEHHWKVHLSYKISLYKGNDPSTALELQSRNASAIVVTSGGQVTPMPRRGGNNNNNNKPTPPIPEKTVHPTPKIPVTFLFQQLDPESLQTGFAIDRTLDSCKTPRRNAEIESYSEACLALRKWVYKVSRFFLDRVESRILVSHDPVEVAEPDKLEAGTRCEIFGHDQAELNDCVVVVQEYQVRANSYKVVPQFEADGLPPTLTIPKDNLRLERRSASPHSIKTDDVFAPILPLLENGTVLALADTNALLDAQKQSIQEAWERQIVPVFAPAGPQGKLISQAEAMLHLLLEHWMEVLDHYQNGIGYIEDMLRRQLRDAIGKTVVADDFDAFMRFHNQKLFGPQFAPKPFTYAIRRPEHYPDGILAIEPMATSKENPSSIETMVRHVSGGAEAPSIFMPINAATSIELRGDRYLHGWMQHRFQSHAPDCRMVARARQFSSFLLVVGTMAGANKFDPKAAMILQNKDEVIIPLLTNVLPSAKEFKDAIASLSPEQQDFCRAFRGMQLESSVFGVCVIQLKPQLEKLLGLTHGALTKEIQLTQALMSLFVEHQIPSDLLSYEGDASVASSAKLDAVKGHVKAVMDVITAEKEKQLQEEERKADMQYEIARQTADHVAVHHMHQAASLEMGAPAKGGVALSGMKKKKLSGAAVMFGGIGAKGGRNMMARSAMADPMASGLVSGGAGGVDMALERARRHEDCLMAAQADDLDFMDDGLGFDDELGDAGDTEPNNNDQRAPPEPTGGAADSVVKKAEDFTLVPKMLDDKFAKLDTDNALRSTILTAAERWTRKRQENLLVALKSESLDKDAVTSEKNKAFDLLDAISRSGTLPIDCSELHVVIAVSHCFENDVMGTVVQDNINPIAKVEKSSLLVASTIHGVPCQNLVGPDHAERLAASFPSLFLLEN